jgi:dUTP pyrophosphatase
MILEIQKLSSQVPSPKYATSNSAAFDLVNASGFLIAIHPGEIKVIPTGIAVKLPPQTAGLVTPRSGKSISGFSVNNSPGIVDSDYRDEVKVIAVNTGNNIVYIDPLERIAQFMVVPYIKYELQEVEQLSEDDFVNDRKGGLGHTGK